MTTESSVIVKDTDITVADNVDKAPASRVLTLPLGRKTDIFDAENFDAIKFINKIYPDESSLSDLDKFVDMLKKQIRAVDKEIFQAVRQQSGSHMRARQDLSVAHQQILELFGKVQDIERKAEESEMMVQEICRDIKKLDTAKKHLTNSITSLRRLAMLTAAITDLEQVAYRRDQYKKCADLLEAVSQLLENFQQYDHVPKVKALNRRLQTLQAALQEAVLDDFKLLMGTADSKLTADNLERLSHACLVINALGEKVKDRLMDWLCDREMGIYQAIFSSTGETAKLDRFDRRFTWFKNRLEEKKDQLGIFPPSWHVPHTLAITFCKITKAHLKRMLDEQKESVKEDVGPLIKCVVATNKFEKEMAAMFGGTQLQEDEDDELPEQGDTLTASEARRRLEAYRKKVNAQNAARDLAPGSKKAEDAERANRDFQGSISEAFEDSLRYYVAEEERELTAYLEGLMKEEADRKWVPADDDSSKILQSSNRLFLKIRTSMTRCVKLLSKGNTLLGLSQAFQKVLSLYSTELMKRLPKTKSNQTTVAPPFIGTEWHIKVSDDDEKVVCYILHTAEYCRDTVEGLVTAIQKDIRPSLADQVEMSDQESAFINVASQCLSVLVLGVNTKLDAALQEMERIRWDMVEQPGDDSVFVNTVRKVLFDCAPRIGQELDKTNFSFFCDKMARMFVPRFVETIYRLRKISEKGTLQLSIDTDAIKRILLEFPRAARPLDPEPDVPSYTHYLEREMGAAVNLVKVLQSKPENLVDTFFLLMPANSKAQADFQKVLDLKIISKKQASDLLAAYQKRLGLGEPGAESLSGVPAAAVNLGAFKINMNNFTSNLTNTFNKVDVKLNVDGALSNLMEKVQKPESKMTGFGSTSSFNPKSNPNSAHSTPQKAPSQKGGWSSSPALQAGAGGSRPGALPNQGGQEGPGGAMSSMKEAAAKTREGFARIGTHGFFGKLGGSQS